MAIPKYEALMLPLLKLIDDGKAYKVNEIVSPLADQFMLTEEERQEQNKSGTLVFKGRVGWAKTYLKQAGLIKQPQRGNIQITERGIATLEQQPAFIDNKYLLQFPDFVDFKNRRGDVTEAVEVQSEGATSQTMAEDTSQTPDELIEKAHQDLRQALSAELLDRIRQVPPTFFEQLVVDLLVKMGYGGSSADAAQAIGRSGDGGIDGIIKEDVLGLDVIYIQAKRYGEGHNIGRPEIQQFIGALTGHQGAGKGVFLTTSGFTKEAVAFAKGNSTKIVLIDGQRLTQLMIDYNLGVSVRQNYEVKRIDSDYFDGEND